MTKFGFGKGQKFDLIQCPYGRRGSYFYLYEDYETPTIRLSDFRNDNLMSGGEFQFDIKLLQAVPNGGGYKPVRYHYFADAGSLKMTQYGEAGGWVEIALTEHNHFRIRGNTAFEIVWRPKNPGTPSPCEGIFYPLFSNNDVEASFGKHGKVYFRNLKVAGNDIEACSTAEEPFKVRFLTKSEFDWAVYGFDPDVEFAEIDYKDYEEFDKVVALNKFDFEEFKKNYPEITKRYAETAEYAMWLIWSHRVKAGGYYKSPMILMHLQWLTACASWQQSYNAMPMLANPQEGWRQICSLFEHQDERTGQLPGMLFYSGAGSIQAPFQGFALDYLIRRSGDDSFLTEAECKRMFPKFAKWANYWTTYRSAGRGDDVTAIKTPHDSGWDDASIFNDGFPVSNPDIMAFLVLLMECTARLANGAGDETAGKEWKERSERLLNTLITEFWDGEKFVTKKNATDPVDSLSLACYQPICLGKRLPKEIIDKCAERLTAEGEWLSPIGLMTESLKSPLLGLAHQFVLGRVVAPANMILIIGLYMAGKTEAAKFIANRYCDNIKEKGMILGFSPIDTYPDYHKTQPGQKIDFDVPPIASDPWPWSTWTANCFLTIAELFEL